MCALEALLIVLIHKWCASTSTIDCMSGAASDLLHTSVHDVEHVYTNVQYIEVHSHRLTEQTIL